MSILVQDFRFAVRLLAKNPGHAVLVILILTIGIGAATAVFSVVNGILLQPLPYRDPDRLVILFSMLDAKGSVQRHPTSGMNFLDWKSQSRSFEEMGVCRFLEATYRFDEGTDGLNGLCISPNFLPMLGLTPIAGRTFLPEETWPNDRFVILGYEFWRRRFQGDESVLGKVITLGKKDYTVVGVMGPAVRFFNTGYVFWKFAEVNAAVDFWVPVDRDLLEIGAGGRDSLRWDVVARLKPGVALANAQHDMDQVAERVAQEYPKPNRAPRVQVLSLHRNVVGEVGSPILLAAAAAGLVLLIACVNVANLLLAQALARRGEMALRAGKWEGSALQNSISDVTLPAAAAMHRWPAPVGLLDLVELARRGGSTRSQRGQCSSSQTSPTATTVNQLVGLADGSTRLGP